MQNKNQDSFEISQHKKLFEHSQKDNNFFLIDDNNDLLNSKISEPSRRLNDYDFNLLKEDAYKDVDDDLFKLEYKISKTEEEIKNINTQIQTAKEIKDFNLIQELEKRKRLAAEDYEALVAMYNKKSLSAKITNAFGNKMKSCSKKFQKYFLDLSENLLSKIPNKFSSILALKKSLNTLENINRSVDELMSLNIPYGENIDKYEQLSRYIIKANSIQKEISQHIK